MTTRLRDTLPTDLPEETRDSIQGYVKDALSVFGQDLVGLILYGSAARGEFLAGRSNLNFLLVTSCDLDLLRRYAKTHRRWASERVVVPLFLTEPEIRASHRYFPLEYLEMKEHHVLLMGHDPLPALRIDLDHLAVQCAQEIMGNLMRLRQRFVEGEGTSEGLGILLPLSLTALLPCLRGQYHLRGLTIPHSTDALLNDLPSRFGIETAVFHEAWNLKKGMITPGPIELPRLFERYMAALQALAEWSRHQS